MNNKIFTIVLSVLCFILCILTIKQCYSEKQLNDNYVILSDSISVYENRIGELYKEKQSYILDINNLKEINERLYKEVKNLKDNPIVITHVETVTKIDSIFIKKPGILDSLSNITNDYYYNDNHLSMNINHKLNTNTLSGQLNVNNILLNTNIYTNIVEDKKNKSLHLLVKSDNPYIQINNINGGFIDISKSKTLNDFYKRENRWSLTITAGLAGIYDLSDRRGGVGPGIMIGVSYNILTW